MIDVRAYLPLVKTATNVFKARGCPEPRDDLYQAGCEGLWDAARRYKADGRASFTTYAVIRIKGAIVDYLRSVDPLARSDESERPVFVDFDSVLEDPEFFCNEFADPFIYVSRKEAFEKCILALSGARGREIRALTPRFTEGKTLAEIGARNGVGESRACQWERELMLAARKWGERNV